MKAFRNLVAGAAVAGVMLGFGAVAASAQSVERWGGLYIGAHVGGAWADADWNNVTGLPTTTALSFDNSGWLAGGQIGYQAQFNRWVLGAEASVSGGDLDDRINDPVLAANTYTSDIDWLTTIVARLGYVATDNLLLYVKGGYAGAHIDTLGTAPLTADSFGQRDWVNGWTVGVGLEYMLLDGVSLGLDYSYIDLDATSIAVTSVQGVPVSYQAEVDGLHAVTARLNFKLGGRREQFVEPLK